MTVPRSSISDAVRLDSAELQCEVLLWQRWIRYAGAAVVAIIAALAFLRDRTAHATWLGLLAAAAGYAVVNAAAASALKRRPTPASLPHYLPDTVLITDVLLLALTVYVTSPPAEYSRLLLLGCLVNQLTVFYFGRVPAISTASIAAGCYLMLCVVAPPIVAGPAPSAVGIAMNTILFSAVTSVFTFAFASFRDRLTTLREMCKRVELGDLTGEDPSPERYPDQLTLLARSFSEMRGQVVELIGSDPLTGCLNRRALETRLAREWRHARRRGTSVALLAIDCDNFKEINDVCGHGVGDIVLQELAEIMRATARDTDAVARLGGDEFIIVLPDTGWQGALTFAERLRTQVEQHVFGKNEAWAKLSISVGVAIAHGSEDLHAADLLETADRNLYKAKSAGRNRISA